MPSIGKIAILQTAFLTVGFGAAYFLIRAMPVESCDILHYGQYMNELGEVEFCGPGEVQFYDLSKILYPVTVGLQPQRDGANDGQQHFLLNIADYAGVPLSAQDIAVSHTERIHLMAVDSSLEDYAHLHPVPTGNPGEFAFSLNPRMGGDYSIYLDFIPIRSGRRVLTANALAAGQGRAAEPSFTGKHSGSTHGYTFTVEGAEQALELKKDNPLRLTVRDAEGHPAQLEPVMDAWAHLVAFDPQRKGFAHLHPLTLYLRGQPLRPPEALDFMFSTDKPGDYRLWAQVKIDGQELFVPFDLRVAGSGG